jgi:hypothetical protein
MAKICFRSGACLATYRITYEKQKISLIFICLFVDGYPVCFGGLVFDEKASVILIFKKISYFSEILHL